MTIEHLPNSTYMGLNCSFLLNYRCGLSETQMLWQKDSARCLQSGVSQNDAYSEYLHTTLLSSSTRALNSQVMLLESPLHVVVHQLKDSHWQREKKENGDKHEATRNKKSEEAPQV